MPAKGQPYKKAAPKKSLRPKARPKDLAAGAAVCRGNNAARRRAMEEAADRRDGKKK